MNSNNNNSSFQQERLMVVQAALAAFAPNGVQQQQQPESLVFNPPAIKTLEYKMYPSFKAMLDDEQLEDAKPWRQVPHFILSFNSCRWRLNSLWWDKEGNRCTLTEQLPMTRFVQLRSSTHSPVGSQQQQQVLADDPARCYRVQFVFADQSPEVTRLNSEPSQSPLSYLAMTMFMSVDTQQRLFADLEKARLLDCPPFLEEGEIVRSGKLYWAVERVVASCRGLRLFPTRGEESEKKKKTV
ncbi:hypothetical protein TYRP_014704 [Tyrophagus putrescentiae]|nr:hypothetical protein TYRP_014704 [Tyrophagus putrescentiae]